jgi:hypothetical protein
MTESNSYLVPARLVEIERDYPPYKKGSLWAAPDLDAAAAMMVRVKNNPDEVRAKCAEAKDAVERLFDPRAVGQQVAARLSLLHRFYAAGSM